MKIRFSFLFFLFLLPALAFLFVSWWRLEPVYHLVPSLYTSIRWEGEHFSVATEKPYNTWYVGIPKESIDPESMESLCVNWYTKEERYRECLDGDGIDMSGEYYSFPVQTSHTREIAFTLNRDIGLSSLSVYALDTDPVDTRIVWWHDTSYAEDGVISRAEWGADETLRYTDHPENQKRFRRAEANAHKPLTAVQLADQEYRKNANAFLRAQNHPTTQTATIVDTENGHRLVWPIEKVKQINRIVVHHTAMSFKPHQSDEAMLRAIYAYHTLTRGWGDIGYNYLIGQNGDIYEGRAGGDYVVGAHAVYNNMGSVGISVMGDYNASELWPAREAGLKAAIAMNAKKYGIDLSKRVVSYRMCRTADCSYPLRVIPMPALIGHQDVQVTSCPGDHIYPRLWTYIQELAQPYTPILNTDSIGTASSWESASSETPESSPLLWSASISRQKVVPAAYFGKKMRVRLSYPHAHHITLSSYDTTPGVAFLDYQRTALSSSVPVMITSVWTDQLELRIGNEAPRVVSNFSFSAPVVSVDSWTRIPDWDKKSQYNDNLFRDTIEVYNEHGSLVVVNHLPLEWYLKGLGEVSNGDLPEKIKTITVAARTYALYYMQNENRKYQTNRYDGSDDPDSFQKYIWYSYEMRSPQVAHMVDQTRNQVIRYRWNLIKPWYFSRSDGRTLSALEYCQMRSGKDCQDIAYLQSVSDPGGRGHARSGHGVGISGIGATHFAHEGWDYKKIIQYYLQGVEISL